MKHYFTSESVTEGHPDKVCDLVSDVVLDDVLRQDSVGRVACETYVTMGLIIIGGEITTTAYVDIHKLCRDLLKDIGYTHPKYGFDYHTCAILNAIHTQSPDIAKGVDKGGAGDQGMMVGYACKETEEFMPLPITLAHKLTQKMAEVRKKGILKYLGPDGKSQVTLEYDNGKPTKVTDVVLACQHTDEVLDKKRDMLSKDAREEIINTIAKPVLENYMDKKTRFFVNETGKFVIGGPQSDTGMTGRKIMVDTYGGMASHGGGSFCIAGDSLVNTNRGLLEIKDMKKDIKQGILVKTDIHPQKANEWFDNGEMETIKITTSDGYSLEGSKNQCIRVIDRNGNYVWKRLDQIKKEADFVAIQRKNRLFGKGVDLSAFSYKYKEGTAEGRKNKFTYPKKLTEDYAYLLGLLIGDGNCMMSGGIAICVCESQQKENVQQLYKRLFDKKGKIFGHWAFMGGVELRAFLEYLGLGYKRSWEKTVPHVIFKSPKKIVAAFLRGLFDTDGGVRIYGRKHNFPDVYFYSSSFTLTQQVQQLLLNFNIISNIGVVDNRGREIMSGRKVRRIVYKLRIKGVESVRNFKSQIGFKLKRKQKILYSVNLESKREKFIVPNQRERIKRLFQKLSPNDRYIDKCKIGRFTRKCKGKATKELTYNKLNDFLVTYKNRFDGNEEFKYLDMLNSMSHYYAKVEDIELSSARVFDLSVPMSHTFTANGFVCHNSGKDPTKVDRSGAYMARYVAKNVVAAGLAEKCELQVSYCIGVTKPISLYIDTKGTNKIPEEKILEIIKKHFDFKPKAIIEYLNLRRPIYRKTAAYGHFGRSDPDFTWEKLDMVKELEKYL